MKTRYSRFDTGFLELVDETDFVRNNRYGCSLVPEKVCPCHNGNTIDDYTDNVITKLSTAGVLNHFPGGGFKLSLIGDVVQRTRE